MCKNFMEKELQMSGYSININSHVFMLELVDRGNMSFLFVAKLIYVRILNIDILFGPLICQPFDKKSYVLFL